MVQLANFGTLRPESELPSKEPAPPPVKLEIEDPLDEQHGPLNKRSKITAPLQQQNTSANMVLPHALQCNLLNEPSPLGLRLRKSPSLVDLIQMRLSEANTSGESSDVGKKKVSGCIGASSTTDKMKASNFPASLLRIGTWEYASTYEGDLVAKCYFAKHKLVWEILDGGLKSKIETQWSDITALKATCPENGPGTLDIMLARQPLFFRETNPQPRKHTLWQETSDFTGGQASIHRRHCLQCSQGLLSKHIEKLIQCDPRLYALSRQPNIILENPYFEPRCSVFEDQVESECHGFGNLRNAYGSPVQGFQESVSPRSSSSITIKSEVKNPIGRAADVVAQDTCSPSSVMDTRVIEEIATRETKEFKDPGHWDQFKVPGIWPSMSMSDLVNHIGHCISEQINSGNPLLAGDGLPTKDVLEEITQYLSDSQISSTSDENSLMLNFNSLCCLIQKDGGTAQSLQINNGDNAAGDGVTDNASKPGSTSERKPLFDFPATSKLGSTSERKPLFDFPATEGESNDASGCKQQANISRKESFGELLMHLPRIDSLPQFLFNISEDAENEAR
ncbi:uncharacterized protein LOC103707259 isoform X2 [Phoenix dactylifera]|uniref:Uncharacterized protein LOC103707259 isoform X2 n=1 Tax=Phoenix dactylifera TaxID=42345 RepID=A0A8B8J4S3_PHODC|nr:uncharacterized protein LOC103707259 isoform X2 [Phoenix dactylifera]